MLDRSCRGIRHLLFVTVRDLRPDDWPAVEAIYREGIDSGNATFEADPPTWEAFDSGKLREARLVAVDEGGVVVGWAAASPVSSRAVYRGVIEHSFYVAEAARGRGVGRALLKAFLDAVESAGYWMVQSSIFPENTVSLALHKGADFRVVGRRCAIALMSYGPWAGDWRDTILVEWRSTKNGQRTRPECQTEPMGKDTGANASGNQSDSAQTWDEVDSGQSDDIENSLTAQGTSDRETTREVTRDEAIEAAERARIKRSGGTGGGGGGQGV